MCKQFETEEYKGSLPLIEPCYEPYSSFYP